MATTSVFPTAVDQMSGVGSELADPIVQIETILLNRGTSGVVNALGTIGATATLKPGFNTFTTSANITALSFPASPSVGMAVSFESTQAAGAHYTMVLNPVCIAAGGSAPALSAVNAAVDFFSFEYDGAHWVLANSQKALA